MKIAVQLYGHLRTFEKCAGSLFNSFPANYEVDVFLHTWDISEHSSRSWYPNQVRAEGGPITNSILKRVNDLYQPKRLKFGSQNFVSIDGHFGTHDNVQISLAGLKYMHFSMQESTKLRNDYETEQGIHYDYVLVTRPDIELLDKLDFDTYAKHFTFYNKTIIHFVHQMELQHRGKRIYVYPQMSEVLFLGKPETINLATSMYQYFDRYMIDFPKTFEKQVEIPEIGWRQFLTENAIASESYKFYSSIRRADAKYDITYAPKMVPTMAISMNSADNLKLFEVDNYKFRSLLKKLQSLFEREFKKMVKCVIRLAFKSLGFDFSRALASIGYKFIAASSYARYSKSLKRADD
jgi:hypothetical protein